MARQFRQTTLIHCCLVGEQRKAALSAACLGLCWSPQSTVCLAWEVRDYLAVAGQGSVSRCNVCHPDWGTCMGMIGIFAGNAVPLGPFAPLGGMGWGHYYCTPRLQM